jgi:hypothetical protein
MANTAEVRIFEPGLGYTTIPAAWVPTESLQECLTWLDGGDCMREAFKEWVRKFGEAGSGEYHISLHVDNEQIGPTEMIQWSHAEDEIQGLDWDDRRDDE